MGGFFDNDDVGKLIVRLTVSILILFHGIPKLLNFSGTVEWLSGALTDLGLPEFVAYGVFFGEVVGPLMILLGFYTRWGGVLVVINMLFAIGMFHLGDLIALNKMGALVLQLDYFFLFVGLAVCFLGSGRYALRRDD